MTLMKKRIITSIVLITVTFGWLSGCTDTEEKKFTESITILEPDLGDDWTQWNYTYEINYTEKLETNPTYGLIIPEYLLMNYNGAHLDIEKKSMNIIILKVNSVKDSLEVYQRYKNNILNWGGVETGNETIGDESWIGQTASSLPLVGVVFRRYNCVVVVGGFMDNIDITVFLDLAKEMESEITRLSSYS